MALLEGNLNKAYGKLDVRYRKEALLKRIEVLSKWRDRVHLSKKDALDFLREDLPCREGLVFLDPPYVQKGKSLYKHHYVEKRSYRYICVCEEAISQLDNHL